jgi:hypothetical protein
VVEKDAEQKSKVVEETFEPKLEMVEPKLEMVPLQVEPPSQKAPRCATDITCPCRFRLKARFDTLSG